MKQVILLRDYFYHVISFFKGILGARFGSLESDKIGSLESEKSSPYRSIPGT